MATTALQAVNALLNFSSGDQEALLEVMEDYFTSPVGQEVDEIDDDDDDSDDADGAVQPLLEGSYYYYHCSTSFHTIVQ